MFDNLVFTSSLSSSSASSFITGEQSRHWWVTGHRLKRHDPIKTGDDRGGGVKKRGKETDERRERGRGGSSRVLLK